MLFSMLFCDKFYVAMSYIKQLLVVGSPSLLEPSFRCLLTCACSAHVSVTITYSSV